ncbi:hypothetical protein SH668x_002754 [Planctomicrobium sp. SH668]|uniref:hypothetical protein n=1 Tax=Planctomicrobium sp. SH668 TaxID=3448126 RepID=UPI003F5C0DCE
MEIDPVVLLSRVLHVLGAIALLGGAIFTRYVLLPTAETLPENEHAALKAGVTKRWKMFVHVGITVLILTGFYNFIVVAIPQHKGDGQYHMLMGIKILIAMVVFFLASVLPGRTPAFEGMRKKSKFWLTVTIFLAVIVVALGSSLKVRGIPAKRVADPGAVPAATADADPTAQLSDDAAAN